MSLKQIITDYFIKPAIGLGIVFSMTGCKEKEVAYYYFNDDRHIDKLVVWPGFMAHPTKLLSKISNPSGSYKFTEISESYADKLHVKVGFFNDDKFIDIKTIEENQLSKGEIKVTKTYFYGDGKGNFSKK